MNLKDHIQNLDVKGKKAIKDEVKESENKENISIKM
jgi:hypothetical protein